MKKKICSFLLVLLLCVSLPIAAFALEELPGEELLLQDKAGLLSAEDASALREKLDRISKQYHAQVCVATYSTTEGGDIDTFIVDLYDHSGYGYGPDKDGILLLLCMDVRQYRIWSDGFAEVAISPEAINNIATEIMYNLSAGDYAGAFHIFADQCDYYLNGHLNGFPFKAGRNLIIALVIGLVVALIVTGLWRKQLKSVRMQYTADAYVRAGSMQITQSGDYFMYRHITRTRRAQSNNSSSRGGGGSSRSIGGGSF